MRPIKPFGLVALLLLASACARPVSPLPEAPVPSPTATLPIVLPRDAGPHDALTEWWYVTGHLRSDRDQHAYGFEFTIFQSRRQGAPTGYLAHFAVSDIDGQRFSHQSHIAQGEAAPAFPLDVRGWRLGTEGPSDTIQASMEAAPGADPPLSLQLRLTSEKPPAPHHGGYIELYGLAGASYYYSRTRNDVSGSLRQADGEPVPVSGLAWMDHQWGNFIGAALGGWDWYSLQLDDRTELMLYVLRGTDGGTTGVYGTLVLADGSTRDLGPASVHVDVTGRWTSPHTGAVYPSGWDLTLPGGEHLELRPSLLDQELYFPGGAGAGLELPYWEGAVRVDGDRTGVGYVELTGYAGL